MYEKAITYLLEHNRHVIDFAAEIRSRDGVDGDRAPIYPLGEVPQGTRGVYITYTNLASAGDTKHQQGSGGLVADFVLVTAWARDYSDAVKFRDIVREALESKKGTYDGEILHGIFVDARRHDVDPALERSEHGHQAASLVFKIWHGE